MTMIPPSDYLTGVRWMKDLDSSSPIKKSKAEQSPPKAFSGNSDTSYTCPDFFDDRIFFSTERGWPDKNFSGLKNVLTEQVPVKLKDLNVSRFIRDSSVTLIPKGFLIPYNIKGSFLLNRFLAMLPDTSNQFIINATSENTKPGSPYGSGFQMKNTIAKMCMCYKFHVPFRQATTCIEGGNCFLFMSNGRKKAIVGEHSVLLSMIALEEQDKFEDINTSEIDKPSSHAIRMARNLTLHQEKYKKDEERYPKLEKFNEEKASKAKKIEQDRLDISPPYAMFSSYSPRKKEILTKDEVVYRKSLISPLTKKDKTEYFDAAILLEAKLRVTKQTIAKELGLDLEDVAIIPQRGYHIDLELCAMPDGRIMLHDPGMVEEFLKQLSEKASGEKTVDLLKKYAINAKKDAEKHGKTLKKTLKILKDHHIISECLPAVFRSSKLESQLNYCNGVFLNKGKPIVAKFVDGSSCYGTIKEEGSFFVTTGPSNVFESIVHKHFVDLFNKIHKNYTCLGVDGMSNFIERYQGGVRCLTLNVTPPIE